MRDIKGQINNLRNKTSKGALKKCSIVSSEINVCVCVSIIFTLGCCMICICRPADGRAKEYVAAVYADLLIYLSTPRAGTCMLYTMCP
jgi:hypothetical protein